MMTDYQQIKETLIVLNIRRAKLFNSYNEQYGEIYIEPFNEELRCYIETISSDLCVEDLNQDQIKQIKESIIYQDYEVVEDLLPNLDY